MPVNAKTADRKAAGGTTQFFPAFPQDSFDGESRPRLMWISVNSAVGRNADQLLTLIPPLRGAVLSVAESNILNPEAKVLRSQSNCVDLLQGYCRFAAAPVM
jgi:hypothetical protein